MMTDHSNNLEFVEFKSEFKADDKGIIEGYGAVFGNVDTGRDVIQAGAFSESLISGDAIKMLWQHDPWQPIGVWSDVSEDEKGLRVKGIAVKEVQAAKEALALIKVGAIGGLSIGYRALESRNEVINGVDVRVIEKAELWEVSIVTFPMNTAAKIDAVKAAEMTQREFGRALLRESKLTRPVVDALMRGGWKDVQALRDSGGGDLNELMLAMMASTKRKSDILRK